MDENKLLELNEKVQNKEIFCGVFRPDKITLCSYEAVDVILVGDVTPSAMLPVCQSHGERLEKGEAFLIMELDGGRNFAIQYGDGSTPVDNAILEEPSSDEPPTGKIVSLPDGI